MPRQIGIIGNDRVTVQSSEFIQALKANQYTICDIAACRSYDEYLQMAESSCFISYYPTARAANEFLSARLKRDFLHLPLSYNFEEIMGNYRSLSKKLNIEFDFSPAVEEQGLYPLGGGTGGAETRTEKNRQYACCYRLYCHFAESFAGKIAAG